MRPVISPLDAWIKDRIGLRPEESLKAPALIRFQLERLRRVIRYARERSPFYRERLNGLAECVPDTLEEIDSIPFTTEADLRTRHVQMLCVSQGDVSRVVTLPATRPGDAPKRLYFSDEDLEQTVDFFHHGMRGLVQSGARVLILLPGQTPGSVGDLLKRALERMNAEGLVHGPVTDPARAVDDLLGRRADALVGLPTQVLSMARHPRGREIPPGRLQSVLLSADYVPQAVVAELEERWEAPVFEHYGMTEMGLGGGVQCGVREGYHLREADLLLEVIHPVTGLPVAVGETGEIAFTALTRQAMPLIRYRTGDLARFLPGPCPCGSDLRRLGKVSGRVRGRVQVGETNVLTLPDMDEALFRVPGIVNYTAELSRRNGRDCLSVKVYTGEASWAGMASEVEWALMRIPSLRKAVEEERLSLGPVTRSESDWPTNGTVKRVLVDTRWDA